MKYFGCPILKRAFVVKHIRITLGGMLCFIAVSATAQQVDSSFNNGHYKARLELFQKLPDRKGEIIFLGNSITEAGNWEELYPQKTIINRGISGDNSYGVVARLDEVVSSRPDKIFLLIGINDLKRGTPANYILLNYKKIIQKVITSSPHTMLYLQSVLPVSESKLASFYSKITNDKIRVLNDSLRRIARKYKVPFVDLYNDVFIDKKGQMKQDLTTDGLHLQPAGYLLWVGYLRKNKYL